MSVRGWAIRLDECVERGWKCISPVVLGCYLRGDVITYVTLRSNDPQACGLECQGLRPGHFYEVTGRAAAFGHPAQPFLRVSVDQFFEAQPDSKDECPNELEADR